MENVLCFIWNGIKPRSYEVSIILYFLFIYFLDKL